MTSLGLVVSSPRPLPSPLPVPVTTVTLGQSAQPNDWIGRWVPAGDRAWKLLAADLAVDRLTGKQHTRMRSYSDRLVERARQEEWVGLHHFGLSGPGPLVSAVAAAEMGLPLLLSLGEGEAEDALYQQPGVLRAALRAANAFTAPSQQEADLVSRLLAPKELPALVTVTRALAEVAAAEFELPVGLARPLLGAWGCHGRESGLPLLLDLLEPLGASLLLVGPFEKAELYEMSSLVDHHPASERVLRLGELPEARALGVLRACDLAVFPLRGGAQASYALRALAAGARVIAPALGPLASVSGLTSPEPDLRRAVEAALESWQPPARGWNEAFSAGVVEQGWRNAYRMAGLCS